MQELQQQDSKILRVNATTRLMHIAGILPVTRPAHEAFLPLESRVYYIACGHLALRHFNQRSNEVIPDLSARLEACPDLQLSIQYRDAQYSQSAGARHATELLSDAVKPYKPVAILGAGRSDVSETISTLTGMFQLPQLSPHSSAASLDDKIQYPYFARTTPSNAADGKAAVEYLHSLDVTHMAVIYILDTNGIAYQKAIQHEANLLGMTVYSISYLHDAGPDAMNDALQRLKDVNVRYVFAVTEPATWKEFIRIAVDKQVIGTPEHVWLFHSGMVGLVPEELDKETEYDIARAIHGSGVLLKDFPPNPSVDAALQRLETDSKLQQDFVNAWHDPSIFDGFRFRYPGPNYPQYINYDSVIALGLAACQLENDFFTGPELYQSLLQTEFAGASDYVSFDNVTGSRKSVPFQVDNILLVDKGNGTLGFVQDPAAKIGVNGVTSLKDFVYWDNTTRVPLTLPALDYDPHLLPLELRVAGLTLCALSLLLPVGWSIWTWKYRKNQVVRVSQPFFLIQICVGAFVMASSIIPMSLQEPTKGLDEACMSIPWLIFLGYAIAFSALFCKSWRINKLLASGTHFRRTRVSIADAMRFLVGLLGINVVLLTIWTVVSPLTWQRVDGTDQLDQYGRVTGSYGRCQGDGTAVSRTVISLLAAINGLTLLVTNYQGFKTRSLPTSFNESYYVAMTNAFLLEAFVLGIPILVVADESPSASYIVKTIMVTVVCCCTLLPLFVPKHLQRNANAAREARSQLKSSSFLAGSSQFLASPSSVLGSLVAASATCSGDDRPKEPDPLLGSRIDRHADYYVQRKINPPSPTNRRISSSSP